MSVDCVRRIFLKTWLGDKSYNYQLGFIFLTIFRASMKSNAFHSGTYIHTHTHLKDTQIKTHCKLRVCKWEKSNVIFVLLNLVDFVEHVIHLRKYPKTAMISVFLSFFFLTKTLLCIFATFFIPSPIDGHLR